MGRRGPRPTPTAILEARGSWRAKLGKDEPLPPEVGVEPPPFLSGEALEAWTQLAPMLASCKLLTAADVGALAMLCETWATWRNAENHLKNQPHVIETYGPGGELRASKANPYIAISRNAAIQLTKLFQEFGMTPSSRSRVTLKDPGNEDRAKDGNKSRFLKLSS